jgi:GNAT superfamily N-acetyltransferase
MKIRSTSTDHRARKKEQVMKVRRVEIRDDLKEVEVEGLIHKGAGNPPHEQGPHVDTQVSIRGATSRDAERLRRMFSRLSSETIYLRFHIPYSEVPEQMLALMLEVDHPNKEILVAVSEEEIVGHAMYVRLGNRTEAEMAIVVEDRWQSKGVGKSLLLELAKKARLRGIEIFIGEVLWENRRMQRLAAMFADTHYTMEDDLLQVRMPLRTPEPTEYAA